MVIVGVLLVGAFYALNSFIYEEKQAEAVSDYKDITLIVDGKRFKLENGLSETESATGAASKIITLYFGNEITKDLDGDGRQDVAYLITQQTGGSGTFYYVVAALNTPRGYVGGEAYFLGDRISPQTTESGDGKIVIVNYAERKSKEGFAVSPSIGKSVRLILDPTSLQFGEVALDSEGEADPSKMSLQMKKWEWQHATLNNGETTKPKTPRVFTIEFSKDGTFVATTDCNSMNGSYIVDNSKISFNKIASTKMYCENSQETIFGEYLRDTTGYHFTSRGELIFDLKFDSGSVVFR